MRELKLMYHVDTQGRKWLSSVLGSGKTLEIPQGVYGIVGGAFMMVPRLEKVYIPESVQEIMGNTFGSFDSRLTIYCEAGAKPDGWQDSEIHLNKEESGMERIHDYWLGNAKFTFDANGILTYLPLQYRDGRPKVVWGYKK